MIQSVFFMDARFTLKVDPMASECSLRAPAGAAQESLRAQRSGAFRQQFTRHPDRGAVGAPPQPVRLYGSLDVDFMPAPIQPVRPVGRSGVTRPPSGPHASLAGLRRGGACLAAQGPCRVQGMSRRGADLAGLGWAVADPARAASQVQR